MEETKIFRKRYVLLLVFNVLVLMLSGYFIEWAGDFLATPFHGWVRFTLLIVYMVYLILKAAQIDFEKYKSLYEQEVVDHQADLVQMDEYDLALGELMEANKSSNSRISELTAKVEKYENAILADRAENAKLKTSVELLKKEAEESSKLLKTSNDTFERYKRTNDASFANLNEQLKAYQEDERRRQQIFSERGRKGGVAKNSRMEEEEAPA